jgi:hypothetical protein
MFWFHLFITMLSWAAPFLFDWKWTLLAYCIVLLQFVVIGGCIVNRGHNLDDSGENTFYAHLLEIIGFRFDRQKVKTFVRFWIYVILAGVTIVWQLVLNKASIVF